MSSTSLIMTNSVYNYVEDIFYVNDCIRKLENISKKGSVKQIKMFITNLIDELSQDYFYQRNILFDDVFKILFNIYDNSFAAIQSVRNIPEKIYYKTYIKSLGFLKDTPFYDYVIKRSKETKNFYLRFKNKTYMENQLKFVNKQFDILDDKYLSRDLYHKYYQFYTPIFQRIKKIFCAIANYYFENNDVVYSILCNKFDIFFKNTYSDWIKFDDTYISFKRKNNCLATMSENIRLYL